MVTRGDSFNEFDGPKVQVHSLSLDSSDPVQKCRGPDIQVQNSQEVHQIYQVPLRIEVLDMGMVSN